jgi:hypothetical protein
MQLLTSETLEVSDTVRKLILEEWPELVHKLAPGRPPRARVIHSATNRATVTPAASRYLPIFRDWS